MATVSVIAFLFAASLTLQLPQVQTFIAERVVRNLSEKIDGEITFEKIHLRPFTTFILKNALITDKNPVRDSLTGAQVDTFFRARYVIARFSLDGLFKKEGVHLDKVFINNAQMNLVLEDNADTTEGDRSGESLTRILGIKKNGTPTYSEKELFHIKNVEIHNMGFHMFNHKREKIRYDGGINWNDLDVRSIDLKARGLMFKGGIMSGTLDDLNFVEKSGWECRCISGNARVGRGKAIVENLRIQDLWSDICLPLYKMTFKSSKDFAEYIEKVRMDAEIAPSDLDFRTLTYFAPQLGDNRLKARVSGRMSGYVNDFTVSNVEVSSYAGGFSGTVNGRMTGIPDIGNTRIDARLSRCIITAGGLGRFLNEWTDADEIDLDGYAKGVAFFATGRAKGLLDHLNTNVSISSLIGKANARLRLDNIISDRKPFGISGKISTDDLDAGRIIGTDILRQVSMDAGFKAKFGRSLDFPELDLDSLKVDRLFLNGYDYTNLAATGEVGSRSFNGKVICNDPSLNFLFHGTFALSPKTNNALYEFYANIGHADLHAMNIDKRGKSEISLRTSANIKSTGGGEIVGKVDVGDISLSNSGGKYEIGDLSLRSYSREESYKMSFNSSFAEATYTGSAPVTQFVRDMKGITFMRELPALFRNAGYEWTGKLV